MEPDAERRPQHTSTAGQSTTPATDENAEYIKVSSFRYMSVSEDKYH